MKLVIVGAGLAGTWLAETAVSAGHSVIVVSDGQPSADVPALAMLRPSYMSPQERSLLPESLSRWEKYTEVIRGASVTSWNRPNPVFQKDWYAIEPMLPYVLCEKSILGTAEPVDRQRVKVATDRSIFTIKADEVVWCTGQGEGQRTYGATWVHDSPEALHTTFPLTVFHVAPYKALAAAQYKTHCRFGSSSAATPEKAEEQALKFWQVAVAQRWVASGQRSSWKLLSGTRLLRKQYLTLEPDGWHWSGFHRNGFGLVPAGASHVLGVIS